MRTDRTRFGVQRSAKPDATRKKRKISVLLAKTWHGQDPTGWWMSEKLDGVRAYWTGREFVSRAGNVFAVPDWFTHGMPATALDGEFFIGRGRFHEVSGIVRRLDRGPDWEKVRFVIFDAPGAVGGFEKRLASIDKLRLPTHATKLAHMRCAGPDDLREKLGEIEARGGEGVMLRKPGSPYERRRSGTLLKVKNFLDGDARVVGYEPGEGKHRGRVGALLCEGARGVRFKVGTGLSDEDRARPPRVGDTIVYRCKEWNPSGKPREPSFVGARGDV